MGSDYHMMQMDDSIGFGMMIKHSHEIEILYLKQKLDELDKLYFSFNSFANTLYLPFSDFIKLKDMIYDILIQSIECRKIIIREIEFFQNKINQNNHHKPSHPNSQ